ncbi:MAG: Tex-like N-terminal domain-containing protein, partial [Pirellula sp.]
MKDIQAIARYMRLPEEQLKFPVELLNQGYEPNYLANYRPDELGNIDEQTLSILRRALNYSESLKRHKEKVQQTLEREQQWNETVSSVVSQANTISQVDTVTRHLRARRNSRSIVEACPQVEAVGQAILTMQGDAPKDLVAWTAEIAAVPIEQASEVLEHTKQWMIHLLSEDVRLIQDLQRTLLKRAGVSVKILPDPPKGSDAEKQLESAEKSGNQSLPSEVIAPQAIAS